MRRLSLSLILLPTTLAAQHSPYIEAVDEYVPAPGQYINVLPAYDDGDDAQRMAEKCTDALAHNAGGMISLGAWGGYVTFHFDHPLVNVHGAYDLYIAGNAIIGSSEAGIVMVSQDTNGNGLPDDCWYELSGSADLDSTNVSYGYAVAYQRQGDLQDVAWTDNDGVSGYVHRNAWHQQEYFPEWLDGELTFEGTRLPVNAHDTSGNGSYWVLDALRYGYVDNLPNKDTLSSSFDLDWAVDRLTRLPVHLAYADFVRVYTALHQEAGWLGETSTEVTNAIDLHPEALPSAIQVIHDDCEGSPRQEYDVLGRRPTHVRLTIAKDGLLFNL